jgi:hypothetical protein
MHSVRIHPAPLYEDNPSAWKCQEGEKEKHIDIHFSPLISSSLRHSSTYCRPLSFTLLHCHLENPLPPTTTPFTPQIFMHLLTSNVYHHTDVIYLQDKALDAIRRLPLYRNGPSLWDGGGWMRAQK